MIAENWKYVLVYPGMILPYAGSVSSIPDGFLFCDGSAVSRTIYSNLFAVISTLWGVGDSSTTFNLPDGRSGYLKCVADNATDAGGTGGSNTHTPAGTVSQPTFTGDALATHNHGIGTYVAAAPAFTGTQATITHSGTAVADHAAHTHTVTAAGTVAAPTFTGAAWSAPAISWPAGVPTNASGAFTQGAISWPAGVPTHSGITINAFTATINSQGTIAWPAGVPTLAGDAATTATGSSGAVKPTATHTHTVSWPAGVPTHSGTTINSVTPTINSQGTVAWPAGVPTIAAGVFTQPTISWPVGVPTIATYTPSGTNSAPIFAGSSVTSGNPSATLTHSVTQPNDHTYTPAGTVAAPSLSGSSASVSGGTPSGSVSQPTFSGASANYEPAYMKVLFLIKY